jgi:hypothetical protein
MPVRFHRRASRHRRGKSFHVPQDLRANDGATLIGAGAFDHPMIRIAISPAPTR